MRRKVGISDGNNSSLKTLLYICLFYFFIPKSLSTLSLPTPILLAHLTHIVDNLLTSSNLSPLDFLNLSTSFTVASPATPPPSPILASLHLPTNSSSSPKSMSLHLHLHQTRLHRFKLPVLQFQSSTIAAIVNVDSP